MDFYNDHSTDHAIIRLVDQIEESFEKDQYTPGVFSIFQRHMTSSVTWFYRKIELNSAIAITKSCFKSHLLQKNNDSN